MFISNLTHFLDQKGNIPSDMPKEGREMASFLALIVDTATKDYHPAEKYTQIRCLKKKCTGRIEIDVDTKNEFIHWKCNKCQEEGRISDWGNTKWDNRE
ncbi:MAG: hypothetical protein NTY96_13070 [Bacteroidetes bacterium]|nr:hypothetical protein [Bacteroidota bacterium]